jgi:hypothetical protein
LDELVVDLQIGRPRVACRVAPLGVVKGRHTHEVWSFLIRSLVEACHLELSGPVSQPVDRHGFVEVLSTLLDRTVDGPRRALLLLGAEHLDVDTLRDVVGAWRNHAARHGAARRFNLLIAGAVALPKDDFGELETVVLPDLGIDEAVDALHEYLDRGTPAEVEISAALVGGVPALLHAVGLEAEKSARIPATQDGVWRALGGLADELRGVVDIVAADEQLAQRIEDVARAGMAPLNPTVDPKLVRAGLFRVVPQHRLAHVTVRAPVLAQLAGMVISQLDEEDAADEVDSSAF